MKYTLNSSQELMSSALETCDRCLFNVSMRSGKTLALLDYCVKNKLKVLWVVDKQITRDISLPEEIKKWKFKLNIAIECYGSLKKHVDKKYDIVILDEIQNITSSNSEHVLKIKCDKIVGMTGTIPNKRDKLELIYGKLNLSLVYSYTTDDAIEDKSAADFNIKIVEIPLDTKKNILINYIDKKTKTPKAFYTSEADSYRNISNNIEIQQSDGRKKLLRLTRLRQLNSCNSKVEYVKQYIARNKDKRVLIFVATQELAEKCSSYFYHGNSSDKYYNLFQKEKINHLVLVEKGSVGVTYRNLDGCLVTAINSSNTNVSQKLGRTLLFRDDYIAQIEIVISKNTVQKRMIEEALFDFNKNKIVYESIS